MSSRAGKMAYNVKMNNLSKEITQKDAEMKTSTVGSLLCIVMGLEHNLEEIWVKYSELKKDPSEFQDCDTMKELADFYIKKYLDKSPYKKYIKKSLAFIYDDGWRDVNTVSSNKTERIKPRNEKTPLFVLTTSSFDALVCKSLPLYDTNVFVQTNAYGIVKDAVDGRLWAKLEWLYK